MVGAHPVPRAPTSALAGSSTGAHTNAPPVRQVAHSRVAVVSAALTYVTQIETILAASLAPEVLAKTGPRYQNFRQANIDLKRVFWALDKAIRDDRDKPQVLIKHLIALAGQALKAADDVSMAAGHAKSVASVNPETILAVLTDDDD